MGTASTETGPSALLRAAALAVVGVGPRTARPARGARSAGIRPRRSARLERRRRRRFAPRLFAPRARRFRCSSKGRAAAARSSSRAACTVSGRGATVGCARSTAPRSPTTCSKPSSSATLEGHSPARSASARDYSRRRMEAPSFSTKSASCRRARRPNCCACCRMGRCAASARTCRAASTRASSRRPTAGSTRKSRPDGFAPTCASGSTSSASSSRRSRAGVGHSRARGALLERSRRAGWHVSHAHGRNARRRSRATTGPATFASFRTSSPRSRCTRHVAAALRQPVLPAHIARAAATGATTFEAARHEFERRFVRAALAQAGGQRARAAATLGVVATGPRQDDAPAAHTRRRRD